MTDAYEHIAVLVSFIVSLGFAHVFVGLAALIQSPVKVRVSLPHALWVTVALACLLDLWLGVYEYRTQASFAFAVLLLLLAQSAVGYLLAALVMPSSGAAEQLDDLVAFHDAQRKTYLRAFIAYMLLDAVVSVATDPELQNLSDVLVMAVAVVVATALPVLALFRTERWIQVVAPAVVVLMLVGYWALLFPVFA